MIWFGLLVASAALARLPTQPPSFNANSPFMAWTFRQSDCQNNRAFPDDVGNQLSFNLGNTAKCPVRSSAGAFFNNAVIGATVSAANSRQATVESSAVGTTLSSFQAIDKEWSLIFVLTPNMSKTSCDSVNCHMVQFGPSAGTRTTIGPVPNGNYLDIFWRSTDASTYKLVTQFRTDSNSIEYLSSFDPTSFFGGGVPFFIGITIKKSTTLDLTYYSGPVGGSISTFAGGSLDNKTIGQYWSFTTDSTFLLGGTRGSSSSDFGVQGDYHYLALYNRSLSTIEFNQVAATLPNSVPSLRADGTGFSVFQSTRQQINLGLATSYFDKDNDPATKFKLVTSPAKGNLFKNDVIMNSFPTVVSATDNITYLPILGDSSSFNCTSPQSETYSSFTYQVTDGKGDGSVDCSNVVDSSCLSVSTSTGYICVVETNAAPTVTTATTSTTVLTETNTTSTMTLSCGDINNNPNYKLSAIRILSHNTALGAIYYNPTGLCNGTLADFSSPVTFPISGKGASISLCYVAFKQPTAGTIVGTDTFTYQCSDLQNQNSSLATFSVIIQNALQAGCGGAPFGFSSPCTSFGIEDIGVNVSLSGTDAATSHIGKLGNRRYRIDSLPPFGTLYNSSALNAVAVKVGDVFPADNVTGKVSLYYIAPPNFFNAMCQLNTDPPSNLNCPNKVFADGLGKSFYPVITFDYSLGFDDGTGVVYGQSKSGGAQIYVYGVNDGPTALITPQPLSGLVSGTAYPVGTYTTNVSLAYYDPNSNTYVQVTNSSLAYFDPDGDSYRVGFTITIANASAALSNPSYKTYPLVTQGLNTFPRFTLLYGTSCAETGGAGCYFTGKAYKSDLNLFFSQIQVAPGSNSNGDAVMVVINDPVNKPNELDPVADSTITAPVTSSGMIAMTYSSGSSGPGSSVLVSAGLWAGIAAAGIFVLLSCFACWSCIINRAREGERAALWLVRNIICTDVEQVERKPDLHTAAAGARKSLEYAIHKEHQRLAQVYCCALFVKKVCPCMVKFEANGQIPDEEALIQVALDEEAHKLALKHRPDDKTVRIDIDGGDQVKIEGDVIDIISEDILADDSIFDWEKHVDEGTGRVFYYNSKTHESRWTPPTVKVHEQHKIADRTSVKNPVFSPRPPEGPNPNRRDGDNAGSDRVFDAHPPDSPNPNKVEKN